MRPDAGSPVPSTIDVARFAADASRSHDDVVDLDAGRAGEFATYGLGGRVPGVRVDTDAAGRTRLRVRLVVRFGRPIPDIGDEVRSRITSGLHGMVDEPEVHVHVADVVQAGRAPTPELARPGAP